MEEFYQLDNKVKLDVFEQISARSGLPVYAVEKDWWVVQTLRLVFQMEIAPHIVFKGGTSLSKA
jgi:predicted nucleotidyltransferase component of viral defense system